MLLCWDIRKGIGCRMTTSGSSKISVFVDRWRKGEPPCAHAVLRENPESARNKNAVLDLAYEEFCLRREAGESIAPSTFCNQFPTYFKSLERLLDVHECWPPTAALASTATAIDWPVAGDEFLGFQLREELGKGAIGRVFLASEPACGDRLVVLKVSRHGGREAEILGRLPHKHIVPILTVKEEADAGLTAVCMPFLGKATLCDVIDRGLATTGRVDAQTIFDAATGAVPPEGKDRLAGDPRSRGFQTNSRYINAVLRIGMNLASALQFAHEQGILHRDIKASNVLLTSAGVPMLLDFNLSSDERTEDLRIGGTLPYASPEQLRAIVAGRAVEAGPIDARSDVFSLGVVLYELLCGELPFASASVEPPDSASGSLSAKVESLARAIVARQSKGPIPLRTRNPALDPAAANVIERCLSFKPEDRPASAGALAKSLQGCLSPRRRLIRWSRTHRTVAAAVTLAASLLILCGVIAVAIRPPYAVRMRVAGEQFLREGKFAEAVEHFGLALKEKPDDVRSWLGRAATFEHLSDFVSASRDYKSAADYSPAGSIRAACAYCYAHDAYYGSAAQWSRLALEAHEETPEVYNNFAYSMLQSGQVSVAQENLDRAIERHPTFAAPYHNRAVADLRMLVSTYHTPLKTGLDDMEQAIRLEPNCPELLFDAACLNAAAPAAANRRDFAERYVIAALKAGLPHEKVNREVLLEDYRDIPAVKSLLAQPVPPRAAAPRAAHSDHCNFAALN